jgi:ABC-2 type transport system permease protein
VAGLAEVAFQTADLLVGNIERLPAYVRTGQLDAVLLRPLSALGQLLVADAAPRRLGRVAQAAAVLAVGLAVNDVDWTPGRVALVVLAPACGAFTYASLFVAGATTTFWVPEAGETANAVTYGGRDFATYPTPVYGAWFRRVFGYALGLATVAYLPALALLGRDDPLGLPGWAPWAGPAVAAVWCGVAALAWRVGVRRYRSTGS